MPEAQAASPPLPLVCFEGVVLPEWVDYNGHLRDAFYSLLFSYGVDGLMDRIGLDAAGREALSHSLFTLEAHIHYLREVLGDLVPRHFPRPAFLVGVALVALSVTRGTILQTEVILVLV